MKITLKNIIWACLLIITSCSSNKYKSKPNAKVYSISTENEFELIEKNDLPHANYSRSSSKISAPQTTVVPKQVNREVPKEIQREIPKSTPPPSLSNPSLPAPTNLSAKNQERLLEINQQLAFYCMKHRKDSDFGSEEKCLEFTGNVLKNCEKKHQIINTVMVNCIKDRLKKRR